MNLKIILLAAMTLSQSHQMQDCLNDKNIEPPPPPQTKLDLCEALLGFRRDGSLIECHPTAGGTCEVQ